MYGMKKPGMHMMDGKMMKDSDMKKTSKKPVKKTAKRVAKKSTMVRKKGM